MLLSRFGQTQEFLSRLGIKDTSLPPEMETKVSWGGSKLGVNDFINSSCNWKINPNKEMDQIYKSVKTCGHFGCSPLGRLHLSEMYLKALL